MAITLQRGDYVSTKHMTDEVYKWVAEAFDNAGCPRFAPGNKGIGEYLQWDNDDDLVARLTCCYLDEPKRLLSVGEVLNATNAKPKENQMSSIDNLIKARESYEESKVELQKALEKVREEYPWLQVDIREDVQVESLEQPKDLPWTEWKKGDIVEFVGSDRDFTAGKQYLVWKYAGTVNHYVEDDDGDRRSLKAWHKDFKFKRRT